MLCITVAKLVPYGFLNGSMHNDGMHNGSMYGMMLVVCTMAACMHLAMHNSHVYNVLIIVVYAMSVRLLYFLFLHVQRKLPLSGENLDM